MTLSSDDKDYISWIKDNLSAIFLLLSILLVIITIVIYLMPQSFSPFAAKQETVGTSYWEGDAKDAKDESSETIEESWSDDTIVTIGESTLSVGESDNKGNQRVVISENEIIGHEKNEANSQELQFVAAEEENDSLAVELSEQLENSAKPLEEQVVDPRLKNLITSNEQLLAISPYLYTVRLSESDSVESLLKFMELDTLPKEGVYVYQTQRNNKPWYVVIFGQYDSFKLAKEAGVQLSTASSELSAWVEMYETIHQDLRLINE